MKFINARNVSKCRILRRTGRFAPSPFRRQDVSPPVWSFRPWTIRLTSRGRNAQERKFRGRNVQGRIVQRANRPGDETSRGETSRKQNVQAGGETSWGRNGEGWNVHKSNILILISFQVKWFLKPTLPLCGKYMGNTEVSITPVWSLYLISFPTIKSKSWCRLRCIAWINYM